MYLCTYMQQIQTKTFKHKYIINRKGNDTLTCFSPLFKYEEVKSKKIKDEHERHEGKFFILQISLWWKNQRNTLVNWVIYMLVCMYSSICEFEYEDIREKEQLEHKSTSISCCMLNICFFLQNCNCLVLHPILISTSFIIIVVIVEMYRFTDFIRLENFNFVPKLFVKTNIHTYIRHATGKLIYFINPSKNMTFFMFSLPFFCFRQLH